MNVYNWENSSRPKRPKVKKTGTVVFHSDESIDLSYDRLLKEHLLQKANHHEDSGENTVEDEGKRAPLMTTATMKGLKKMGFTGLLPCQAQCYRGIFNRRDVILHSRTGSGKTLAYALPVIERHIIMEISSNEEMKGPFLLIFVFSNELAVQTKGVLTKIYPKLQIAVAGFDDLAAQRCDIVIGTVSAMDGAIRGRRRGGAKRGREEEKRKNETREEATDADTNNTKDTDEDEDDTNLDEEQEDNNEEEEEEEEEDMENPSGALKGVVSAANVRSIVVDEVDLTLGPRFSTVGRRMRNILKFIRRANGSLTDGLLTDFRAHHYILCGATIPNWVIKAGFLGQKKYYYQLVTVGTAKLPDKLECLTMRCPHEARLDTAVRLLTVDRQLGRTVVFGTRGQITKLEESLAAAVCVQIPFRSLNPSKDELDRIAAMEDFNCGTASVLLCTDFAARGLDFLDVDTVFMLSLPSHNMSVETFVHRAGRTARAAKSGRCLLLYDEREEGSLEAIRKNAHVNFKTFIPSTGIEKGKRSGTKSGKATSTAETRTGFALTVKNPFKYSKPTAAVPSALEVLKKNLGELFSNVTGVKEDDNKETLTFEYPATGAHEVKQKLWKYALKELAPKKAA